MTVQVVLCTCGGTLETKLDITELARFAQSLSDVTRVTTTPALCTRSAAEALKDKLTGGGEKLVAFACTRSVSQTPIEELMKSTGLNPDNLVILNAREQLAWVHPDQGEATLKAKMLLKAAVAKAEKTQQLETMQYERYPEALVVGAGVAGLTAASELADQGFHVHVVERKPTIGGTMPLISKTFPEEDCTRCLRGPQMIQLLTKPGITYHVSSMVNTVTRDEKGFNVSYVKAPFKLDALPKKGKGQPVEAAPIPSGDGTEYRLVYQTGLKEAVKTVTESKCGSCASVFPSGLLESLEEPGEYTVKVGTVVLATGFEDFDPTGVPKWGYGLPNVITQYQLARLIDPLGPTAGRVVRPSDAAEPKRIVMVQCVGSRDPEYSPDCSKYCCMAAIKHASVLKTHRLPGAEVTVLYRDIRASGYGFESMYNDAKELGVEFTHGDILSVTPMGEGLVVSYVDGMGAPQVMEADMLVLSTGMKPSPGADHVADMFNVEQTETGFLKEIDEKVANITTRAPGVFIAGTCTGPKNIPDSIAQAGAAAYMGGAYLKTHVEKKVNHPTVDEDRCGKCGICRSVCPYEAITIPEEEYPRFDPLLCQSCGLCVSSCPTHALETPIYGFNLIDEQVDAILSEKTGKPIVVGFACDDCSYNLLDTAGFTGAEYSSSFVPVYVNCMSSLSLRNVLNAVEKGADGVMLVGCVKDRCHFLKGTQRSRGQMDIIHEFFKQAGIATPIKILESSGTMVTQFTEALSELMNQVEEAQR